MSVLFQIPAKCSRLVSLVGGNGAWNRYERTLWVDIAVRIGILLCMLTLIKIVSIACCTAAMSVSSGKLFDQNAAVVL